MQSRCKIEIELKLSEDKWSYTEFKLSWGKVVAWLRLNFSEVDTKVRLG
jgi:hypothetical protein